jgi:hypothetical protein
VLDVGALPFGLLDVLVVLVLEESGATVDTTELPSTEISPSLSAAAEVDVTDLARESIGSRDVEGTPVGIVDAELALTLTAESMSAMPAHT